MSRLLRIKMPGHTAAYHVTTRTRGREFLLDRAMKPYFISLLHRLKALYYVNIAAFTILDNHYHLLVNFDDPEDIDSRAAIRRWNMYHLDTPYMRDGTSEASRAYAVAEMTDVSSFMKRFNHMLTSYYNRTHGTCGTLWEGRFRSMVVERGWALINCAAYIELNSFRASLVRAPEEYEFASLCRMRRMDPRSLLDCRLLDEGLGVSAIFEGRSAGDAFAREVYRAYRAFVYEAGQMPPRGRSKGLAITDRMRHTLETYGARPDSGCFLERFPLFLYGRCMSGSNLARQVYEQWINPGIEGGLRQRHAARWINSWKLKLFAVIGRGRGDP